MKLERGSELHSGGDGVWLSYDYTITGDYSSYDPMLDRISDLIILNLQHYNKQQYSS